MYVRVRVSITSMTHMPRACHQRCYATYSRGSAYTHKHTPTQTPTNTHTYIYIYIYIRRIDACHECINSVVPTCIESIAYTYTQKYKHLHWNAHLYTGIHTIIHIFKHFPNNVHTITMIYTGVDSNALLLNNIY